MGQMTIIGGVDKDGCTTDDVHSFIVETEQWQQTLLPMPTARYGVTVVASCPPKPPAIAVFGGWDDSEEVCNIVEVFCHATSQWHTAEPLPTPLRGITSATVGDITYLLGVHSRHSSTRYCFSVHLDRLIDKASSPKAASKATMVHSASRSLWKSLDNTPLIRSCAASLKGSLLAIGGYIKSSRSSSSAIHILTSRGSWERVRGVDLPEPRGQPTAVCLPSGELMVVGGFNEKLRQTTCSLFLASVDDI